MIRVVITKSVINTGDQYQRHDDSGVVSQTPEIQNVNWRKYHSLRRKKLSWKMNYLEPLVFVCDFCETYCGQIYWGPIWVQVDMVLVIL